MGVSPSLVTVTDRSDTVSQQEASKLLAPVASTVDGAAGGARKRNGR